MGITSKRRPKKLSLDKLTLLAKTFFRKKSKVATIAPTPNRGNYNFTKVYLQEGLLREFLPGRYSLWFLLADTTP
jgi:hypothetical protein